VTTWGHYWRISSTSALYASSTSPCTFAVSLIETFNPATWSSRPAWPGCQLTAGWGSQTIPQQGLHRNQKCNFETFLTYIPLSVARPKSQYALSPSHPSVIYNNSLTEADWGAKLSLACAMQRLYVVTSVDYVRYTSDGSTVGVIMHHSFKTLLYAMYHTWNAVDRNLINLPRNLSQFHLKVCESYTQCYQATDKTCLCRRCTMVLKASPPYYVSSFTAVVPGILTSLRTSLVRRSFARGATNSAPTLGLLSRNAISGSTQASAKPSSDRNLQRCAYFLDCQTFKRQ